MTIQKPKRILRKWGKFPAQVSLSLSKEQKAFYNANNGAEIAREALNKAIAKADKEGAGNDQ